MRITDDCPPEAMLAELFHANESTHEETEVFGNSPWSNHDYICEQLKVRIAVMLSSYTRLGNEVHVTQSMRDNGVDILLEFAGKDGGSKRIGIQVKSNNEAVAGTKSNRAGASIEATLKRQAFESSTWGLSEWWVVLCFDLTKTEHVKLVQRINADLLQKGHVPIRVYEPANAWSLLAMRDDEVDALCVLSLCRDDEILTEARFEVGKISKNALNVVLDTLFNALIDPSKGISLSELIYLASDEGEHNIDQTSKVVDELQVYLTRDSDEDIWYPNPYIYKGLCALYFEGRVRHRLSHTGAANFVSKLAHA